MPRFAPRGDAHRLMHRFEVLPEASLRAVTASADWEGDSFAEQLLLQPGEDEVHAKRIALVPASDLTCKAPGPLFPSYTPGLTVRGQGPDRRRWGCMSVQQRTQGGRELQR